MMKWYYLKIGDEKEEEKFPKICVMVKYMTRTNLWRYLGLGFVTNRRRYKIG